MKILCLCRAGVVRSVALAKILKELFGHDALSVSWQYNSKKTLDILFEWAETIAIVEPGYHKYVPKRYSSKVVLVDIGEDDWHDAIHPELIDKLYKALAKVREKFLNARNIN